MQNPIFPKLSDFQNLWIPDLSEIWFLDFSSTFHWKKSNRIEICWWQFNFRRFCVACKIWFWQNWKNKSHPFLTYLKSDSLILSLIFLWDTLWIELWILSENCFFDNCALHAKSFFCKIDKFLKTMNSWAFWNQIPDLFPQIFNLTHFKSNSEF